MSAAFGLPNIYNRLDSYESRLNTLEVRPDALDQVAEYLFLLELRLKEHQLVGINSAVADFQSGLDHLRTVFANSLGVWNTKIDELQRVLLTHLDNRSTELTQQTADKISELKTWVTDVQQGLLTHLDNRSTELTQQTADKISELKTWVTDVQQGLLTHLDNRSTELTQQTADDLARLRRVISDLRLSTNPAGAGHPGHHGGGRDIAFNFELYQTFEDQFRGSEREIADRQIAYVAELHTSLELGRVLDIGCGRGEWIQVLTSRGFDAYGIDSNPVSVSRCTEKGLHVTVADALEHLRSLEDNSLGVVSLFQVLEHVPLGELPLLLAEVLRVLTPGGAIVAEFPNIQMLSVGASSFWLDPTHLRPLHPLFVEFLAREAGYSSARLHYPTFEDGNVSIDSAALGSPDVALIALK